MVIKSLNGTVIWQQPFKNSNQLMDFVSAFYFAHSVNGEYYDAYKNQLLKCCAIVEKAGPHSSNDFS